MTFHKDIVPCLRNFSARLVVFHLLEQAQWCDAAAHSHHWLWAMLRKVLVDETVIQSYSMWFVRIYIYIYTYIYIGIIIGLDWVRSSRTDTIACKFIGYLTFDVKVMSKHLRW